MLTMVVSYGAKLYSETLQGITYLMVLHRLRAQDRRQERKTS